MLKDKKIIIDVNPDGSITIEAENFVGADCEKATRAIRDALGKTTSVTKKSEYFKKEDQTKNVEKRF